MLSRLTKVLEGASGFLYYVSVAGVTGANAATSEHVFEPPSNGSSAPRTLPIAVGFGVREPASGARDSSRDR